MSDDLYNVKVTMNYSVIASSREDAITLADSLIKQQACSWETSQVADEQLIGHYEVSHESEFDEVGVVYQNLPDSPYVDDSRKFVVKDFEDEIPTVETIKALLEIDSDFLAALQSPSRFPRNKGQEPNEGHFFGTLLGIFSEEGLEYPNKEYIFLRFPRLLPIWLDRFNQK